MGRLFLGTSGYSYQHWKKVFYPAGLAQSRWLEFYCEHFATVELNVTFYRLPKQAVFAGWFQRTPADFVFAAKGSRFITHIKKLKDCREPLLAYKENAAGLKEKLAIILWQLPPNLQFNKERLQEFSQLLADEYPEKVTPLSSGTRAGSTTRAMTSSLPTPLPCASPSPRAIPGPRR